LKVVASRSL